MQDGLSEVNQKLDDIDQAIEDVNVAITETNNLDLDVSKTGKVATVTLTKKDATTKTITLSDGTSLMFNWDGTRLGIKTDEDSEYTYVDLQGVQGPIGPKGEAFTIKKTYTSVAEMNADFNNMQLGDYVMIASTVEIEDNAKLYTRGESQWIFISDFSGAQGIKGETGLTPNIQIGTVVSGNNPSVTRTGTNENPILNFTLVKGDKGDTGNTGPTGATGNGIASITKTSTSGLVDTYTITYTDGTTTTFEVTNGEDGEVTETELNVVRTDVDDLRRNQLMSTETGTNINVDDAFDTRIMEDVMSKESTQDGTPTPESPVEVNTIKGSVTISISNGTTTRDFTISLGDNEIAGIGNYYKDELIIDKNGHCWLNKKTGKYIFTGNEGWSLRNTQASGVKTFSLNATDIINYKIDNTILNDYKSNYLTNLGYVAGASLMYDKGIGFSLYYGDVQNTRTIYINTMDTNLTTFKGNLAGNNLYYVLETEQLIDLNYTADIRLFNGVNNITNSDDMDMEITYVQDINAVINELRNGQAL